MNKIYKCLLTVLVLITFKNGNCCDSTFLSHKNFFIGVYQSGNEQLHIKPDNTFYLNRTAPKYHNDVVMPICYDTIAKGNWVSAKEDVLRLTNDSDFEKIDFDIKQEKKFSNDSIYVQILLPHDDAFFEGRFEYELYFLYGTGTYEINKNMFALPKKKVSASAANNFSLIIKDEYPATCWPGQKCYQRIFFKVFDNFEFDHISNYFTITLDNFNECFVERMDVGNDFILIDGNDIYWRGNIYKRIDFIN